MHLRIMRHIQPMRFTSNLKNVIYYHNVLIIPAASSCNHLFNCQLLKLGKRFKEQFYLFISRFFSNFNLKLTFFKI
jgi:hypothetical protein